MSVRKLVLHIDRLVLRGVDRADAAAVSAALQAELQQLLAAPGHAAAWVARSGAAPEPGRVPLAPGADAAALGRGVAEHIGGRTVPR